MQEEYEVSIYELMRHDIQLHADNEDHAYALAKMIIMGELDYADYDYEYYTESEGLTGSYHVDAL